jgi:sulfur dioxygenase
MIFRQLFEPLSSTYTYFLGCEETGQAVLIDPVILSMECDLDELAPLHTPGHTDGHFAYLLGYRVFTGDALLIEGCGRTDFQNGDADALFHSVREKLFALPDECVVYPGHDYQQRRVSSIGQEKQRNPRLGLDKSLPEFREIMASLGLPYPSFIDHAVPGNR